MFIWNGKYSYKQKFNMFFLYLDNTDDVRLILKTIWIVDNKTILKITKFCRFLLIFLMIFLI